MAATTTSSHCDACGANVGPWKSTISITSECAHAFNLRFVSGSAACPSCALASKDATATAMATNSSSNLSGETSLFGKQQATPPKTNTFGLGPEPSPSPCSACGGAMGRGEATVTSECAHTFHLRCFSGTVCPTCSARWRYEATVKPSSSSSSSSSNPFLSPPQSLSFSQPAGPTFGTPKWPSPSSTPSFSTTPSFSSQSAGSSSFAPPRWPIPSSTPSFISQPSSSSSSSQPSLFSRPAGSTFAPPSPLSTPTARRPSRFSQSTESSLAPSNSFASSYKPFTSLVPPASYS